MFWQIAQGTVIETGVDDDGYPVVTVMDKNGAICTNCEYLHRGGGSANLQYCPSQGSPNNEPEPDELTRVGSRVLVLTGEAIGIPPVILGALDQPVLKETHFSEDSEARKTALDISGAENYPRKVSYEDQIFHQNGSQVVVGKTAGVTLDTTEGETPVRVQVAADSHMRISQADSDTVDHVMLSSKLFSKLEELQATIAALQAQVTANMTALNTLSAGAGVPHTHTVPIDGAPVATSDAIVAAPDGYAPPVVTAIPGWVAGPAETLQASAVRISEKSVSEE